MSNNKQEMNSYDYQVLNFEVKFTDMRFSNVARVEVIDDKGRSYVNNNADNVRIDLQDNGRTLKVFIDKPKSKWLADSNIVVEIKPNCSNCIHITYLHSGSKLTTCKGNGRSYQYTSDTKGNIFDTKEEALLHHANLKYPVGTTFISADEAQLKITRQAGQQLIITPKGFISLSDICYIYNGEKWAEIVKEPTENWIKFQELKNKFE